MIRVQEPRDSARWAASGCARVVPGEEPDRHAPSMPALRS